MDTAGMMLESCKNWSTRKGGHSDILSALCRTARLHFTMNILREINSNHFDRGRRQSQSSSRRHGNNSNQHSRLEYTSIFWGAKCKARRRMPTEMESRRASLGENSLCPLKDSSSSSSLHHQGSHSNT